MVGVEVDGRIVGGNVVGLFKDGSMVGRLDG